MSVPLELNPLWLSARVGEIFSQHQRVAYCALDAQLVIRSVSPNLKVLLPMLRWPVTDCLLTEVFWEFVGAEDTLYLILQGQLPTYHLDWVNYEQPGLGEVMAYFNFWVEPLDTAQPGQGLLLIIEEVTPFARLQQSLVQDRNELRLLQGQLARAHQELQQLNQFKSFMISMVAHDIGSLLSTLFLAAEAVEIAPDEATAIARRLGGLIRTESKQLNNLLNNLRDLDIHGQAQLKVELVACDLTELTEEVVDTLQDMARNKKISLVCERPSQPLWAKLDAGRMRQVLYNLLTNALKYTLAGGRVVAQVQSEGPAAVVRVIDSGPGLTEEQLKQVFNLYYRTTEARQSRTPGTGLGLHIAKTLMDLQKGQIEVSSQLGQGTTFTLRLPQVAAP